MSQEIRQEPIKIYRISTDSWETATQQDMYILYAFVQRLNWKNPTLCLEIRDELVKEGVIPSG